MKARQIVALGLLAGMAWDVARGAAEVVRRFPLVFRYQDGAVNEEAVTPWTTVIPEVLEGQVTGGMGTTPLNLTVRGYLCLAYDPGDVWASPSGTRFFNADVWIEDPESFWLGELESNFGIELSVKIRPSFGFQWPEIGIGKDFRLSGRNEGVIPLDGRFLGILDSIDIVSIPLSEMLGGAAKPLASIISAADDAGVGMASVNGLGEIVVEGRHIATSIGEERLSFGRVGRANAQNVNIPIPRGHPLPYVQIFPASTYTFDVYQQIGVQFLIVDPFAINITPAILERSVFDHSPYVPPSPALLHQWYLPTAEGASAADVQSTLINIPMSDTPDLPDLEVSSLNLQRGPGGLFLATAPTRVTVQIHNSGTRDTVSRARAALHLLVDGHVVRTIQLHDDAGSPSHIFAAGQGIPVVFDHTFAAGEHILQARVYYVEYQYTDSSGHEWFMAADAAPGNDSKFAYAHVYPDTGGIRGRLATLPSDLPHTSGGVHSVSNILVRLDGPGTVQETRTDASGNWQFTGMMEGVYEVSILPDRPTVAGRPWYASKAMTFFHPFGEWNDFTTDPELQTDYYSNELRQMQNIRGGVVDADTRTPVDACAVQLGTPALASVATDGHGEFLVPDCPPFGTYTLWFRHPLYDVASATITPADQWVDTTTREVFVNRGEAVALTPDRTAPSLAVRNAPPAVTRPPLAPEFQTYDQDKATAEYRWIVFNHPEGTVASSLPWSAAPADPEAWTAVSLPMTGLPDRTYRLNIEVRDGQRNLTRSTDMVFRKDATVPVVTVTIASGASTWGAATAPVEVDAGGSDPSPQQVWLSVDHGDILGPYTIPAGDRRVTVPDITLTGEAMFSGNVTVEAIVADEAGNIGTGEEQVSVDLSQRVLLAGGLAYAAPGNVPLHYTWPQFTPIQVYNEPTWGDQLPVGSTAQTQYRAQKLVPGLPINVTHVALGLTTLTGAPPPLHIALASSLNPSNPADPATILAWTDLPADSPPGTRSALNVPVTLPAGASYLVVSCPVNAGNHWGITPGVSIYGGSGQPRFDYVPGTGWVQSTAERDGLTGHGTNAFYQVSFQLFDARQGEARIAVDRPVDVSDPWLPLASMPASVIMTSQGPHAVNVQFTNTLYSTGGFYTDSVIVDATPPVLDLKVGSFDPSTRLLNIKVDAADALSGLATYIRWNAGGPWVEQAIRPMVQVLIGSTAVEEIPFECPDQVGNMARARLSIAKLGDIFPPVATLVIDDGSGVSTDTRLKLFTTASDNDRVARLLLESPRAPGVWEMLDPDTTLIPTEIPPNPVYDPPRVVDGLYTWRLAAVDAAGNTSSVASASVRLDRDTPVIHVCQADGGRTDLGFTTNHTFRLHLHATDGSGAFTYDVRVNGVAMLHGTDDGGAPLVLPVVMPAADVLSYMVELTVTDQAGHMATATCSLPRAHPPLQPVALVPNRYVYNQDLEMRASTFADPDPADFAAAVHWVVRDERGVPVVDSGSVVPSSDRHILPRGTFAAGDYEWTLRYQDRFGLWSPWADPSRFHVYDSADHDGDGLPDDYEVEKFGGLQETAATDFDEDHMPNGDEYRAGTGPNDPASVLAITSLLRQPGTITVEWSSVPGLQYALELRAADSAGDWSPVSPPVTGQPGPLTQRTEAVGTNRWPWLRIRCLSTENP
jgi:hypothetical protein